MRSFIKSHKRISSFGKDDKEKKDKDGSRPTSGGSNTNATQSIKKQPSFEVLSTNNPNVHPRNFAFNTTPISSPKITSPISPLLRNGEFSIPNSSSTFISSPKLLQDEFFGSTPSSPKASTKQYALPLDSIGSNGTSSKKKILKYPKNLFSRSSNIDLKESLKQSHENLPMSSFSTNVKSPTTPIGNQHFSGSSASSQKPQYHHNPQVYNTNSSTHQFTSGQYPLNGSTNDFGTLINDQEDEFYFGDNNVYSPRSQRSFEQRQDFAALGTHISDISPTRGSQEAVPLGSQTSLGQHSMERTPNYDSAKTFQAAQNTSIPELEPRQRTVVNTFTQDYDDFKSRIRNFDPRSSPVIYEEVRNKSLQKLLGYNGLGRGREETPEYDSNSFSASYMAEINSTQDSRSELSLDTNFDKVLVLDVRSKSPADNSNSNIGSVDTEFGATDNKRASTDSTKGNKMDSFKTVIGKVKMYKRKSGEAAKQRSSISSVIDDNRASVIQIDTNKRASILKKLKKNDSKKQKKSVSIKNPDKKKDGFAIMEEEEENENGEQSVSDNESSSTVSNSLAFSFEKDLINGRNISIKYYKSVSGAEKNEEEQKSAGGLYVDDFNADEYGEEDFNDDMNFYDEDEIDDTEHLFNRRLFSDDEDVMQDNEYDDLVNVVNGEEENNFDDMMSELDYDQELMEGEGLEAEAGSIVGREKSQKNNSEELVEKDNSLDDNLEDININNEPVQTKTSSDVLFDANQNDNQVYTKNAEAFKQDTVTVSRVPNGENKLGIEDDQKVPVEQVTESLSKIDLQKQEADTLFSMEDLITNEKHIIPPEDTHKAQNIAAPSGTSPEEPAQEVFPNHQEEPVNTAQKSNSTSSMVLGKHKKELSLSKPLSQLGGFKSTSETSEERNIKSRYSWCNADGLKSNTHGTSEESFYKDDTLNDYFDEDDYLDEVNIIPEDFEFDPEVSCHVYDAQKKQIITEETESEQLKNRMYRSNSYSKKPKPGALSVAEVPVLNNKFATATSGRTVTLFGSGTPKPLDQLAKNDNKPKLSDISKGTNLNDFLSPITEGFSDDMHMPT